MTPESLTQRYCFFDTETSDMIKFKSPNSDPSQPWIVQFAAMVTDSIGTPLHRFSCLVHSNGQTIAPGAEKVHGISQSLCDLTGIHQGAAIGMMLNLFDCSTHLVAHNISFDLRMMKILALRIHPKAVEDLESLLQLPQICTMRTTTNLCCIPFPSGRGGHKWPKLEELHQFLFESPMEDAHDAMVDVQYTAKCFFELKKRGFYAD